MSQVPGSARRLGERSESSRYELIAKLASGGMGSVYVARSRGALGFEHLVAVKRPHPHLLETSEFKATLLEEARIASRIRHGNVVGVRDVVVEGALVYLVMDYIEGASLAQLAEISPQTNGEPLAVPVIIRICLDAASGLHAAHEAVDEQGRPLDIVHRDVSPQNVLVGTDGISRLTDFGIAKCFGSARHETTHGLVKGKLAYIAPEYASGEPIDRRSDVFALGVVLWELLAGRRLFLGAHDAETIRKLLHFDPPAPSTFRPEIPAAVDAVVLKALAKDRLARQATAEEFGETLEVGARAAGAVALHREVAAAMRARVGKMLTRRASAVRAAMVEEGTVDLVDVPAPTQVTAPPTQAEVSSVVPSTVVDTLRDSSERLAAPKYSVIPPQSTGAPASIPRGTAATLVDSGLVHPTHRVPAVTERSSNVEGVPLTVDQPSLVGVDTLMIPARGAAGAPASARTMISNAPAAFATSPMAQRPPPPAATTQPMEPTARREVRVEAPPRSSARALIAVAILLVIGAGGALAYARSARVGPFAEKNRRAPEAVVESAPPPPVARAPVPTAAPSAGLNIMPLVDVAPAPSASVAPPPVHPRPGGRGSSGAGASTRSGGAVTAPAAPTPESSAKLKAAPNPYAD